MPSCRALLDCIDTVGVEGKVTLDPGHGAVGRLVGPDRVDRPLAAAGMLK